MWQKETKRKTPKCQLLSKSPGTERTEPLPVRNSGRSRGHTLKGGPYLKREKKKERKASSCSQVKGKERGTRGAGGTEAEDTFPSGSGFTGSLGEVEAGMETLHFDAAR